MRGHESTIKRHLQDFICFVFSHVWAIATAGGCWHLDIFSIGSSILMMGTVDSVSKVYSECVSGCDGWGAVCMFMLSIDS